MSYVDYKQPTKTDLIERRVKKTCRQVKQRDVFLTLTVLLTCTIAYFFLFALLDHWVFKGGVSIFWRQILFFAGLIAACLYAVSRLVPLLRHSINPLYAAKILEEHRPSMKNTLINWLLLRRDQERRPTGTAQNPFQSRMLDGVATKAVRDLDEVPNEMVVDHAPIIRWGIGLVALVVVLCLYTLFSPKNPLGSFARLAMPFANISTPTRVRFLEITPGNATVAQGETTTISAHIDGVRKNPVYLYYSTDDGRLVDQIVPMLIPEGDFRYECRFPPGKSGFEQGMTYQIGVGDERSSIYRFDVQSPRIFEVQSLTYKYPAYTGVADQTVQGTGDIRAVEGTQVQITAKSNFPLKSAAFVPNGEEKEGKPLVINSKDGKSATFSFFLNSLANDPNKPEYQTYVLRGYDAERNSNRNPSVYRIEMLKDKPPKISWIDPPKDQLKIPQNGFTEVRVSAEDADFGLRNIRIHFEATGKTLPSLELLPNTPATGPTKYGGVVNIGGSIKPDSLRLEVGDAVEYWAEAVDTLLPKGNAAVTERLSFIVDPPKPGAERKDANEEQKQQESQDEQQKQKDQEDKKPDQTEDGEQEEDSQKQKTEENDSKTAKDDSRQQEEKSGGKDGEKSEKENGKDDPPNQQDQNKDDKTQPDQKQNGKQNEKQNGKNQPDQQQQKDQQKQEQDQNPKNGNQKQDQNEKGSANDKQQEKGNGNQSGKQQSGEQEQSDSGESSGPKQQGAGGKSDGAGGQQNKSDQAGDEMGGESGGQQNAPQPQGQNGESQGASGEGAPDSGQAQGDQASGKNGGQKGSPKDGDSPLDPDSQPGDVFDKVLEQMKKKGKEVDPNKSGGKSVSSDDLDPNKDEFSDQGTPPKEMPKETIKDRDGLPKKEVLKATDDNPNAKKEKADPSKPIVNDPTQKNATAPDPGPDPNAKEPGASAPGTEPGPQQQGDEKSEGQKPGQDQKSDGKEEQPGEGGQPGQGQQPGEGQGQQLGEGQSGEGKGETPGEGQQSGGNSPGGQQGRQSGGTGNTSLDPLGDNPEQGVQSEANLDFKEKQTSLALKYLEEEMGKKEPDPELLRQLGWSKDELKAFVEKWKTMSEQAKKATPGTKDDKAWREMLRSLGTVKPARETSIKARTTNEDRATATGSQRFNPPQNLKQRAEAYNEGTGR